MLNSLLPFELDISELVLNIVFDWFEILQVPGYFLDFISQTVDFLSVFRFSSDKFELLLIFFFHFFFEFSKVCIEDLIDAFLQFFQFIFEGETGSGKSTQLPQILCEYYKLFENPKALPVLVTQPRKIATRSLAERVAEEL